jgi:hypothetical protein
MTREVVTITLIAVILLALLFDYTNVFMTPRRQGLCNIYLRPVQGFIAPGTRPSASQIFTSSVSNSVRSQLGDCRVNG